MGNDDLYRKLLNSGAGKRVFRRSRSHQGADWTPEKSSALSGDGIWCPACRQRHGYKTKVLDTKYEIRNSVWYMMWICSKSGNVIKDEALPVPRR